MHALHSALYVRLQDDPYPSPRWPSLARSKKRLGCLGFGGVAAGPCNAVRRLLGKASGQLDQAPGESFVAQRCCYEFVLSPSRQPLPCLRTKLDKHTRVRAQF